MKFTSRFTAFRASLIFASLLGLGLLAFASIFDPDEWRLNSEPFPFRAEKSGEEMGESKRREDWLYFQRAYPADTIPADAGMRMIEQLEREEARLEQLRARSGIDAEAPEQQMVWASIGPRPIVGGFSFGSPRTNSSGRVSAIALDPRYDGVNNQTVYVGGAQGGVWRSTDNGANWTPLTDGQPSLAVGAIAIDPNNPNVIYAGTGESSGCALCYYGAGLLKSTDGGATWTQIVGPTTTVEPRVPAFLNVGFTKITIDPTNTSVIYAATGATSVGNANSVPLPTTVSQVGLWKSTDGGNTWRNLDPSGTNGGTRCHDVVIDPQNNNRVYAAMRLTGVFRSNSGGEPGTWTRLTNGLPEPANNPSNSSFVRIALAS
ncbi:MAG: WD40/YVTN/BNR-like repeat-containing protein, partial [Blastocatellia bacterium]